jgi:hypothetical protein
MPPKDQLPCLPRSDLKDIGSLELFEDFLGLKLHLFEDFRPRKSSKRCNFQSLKLTYLEEFLFSLFSLLSTALSYKIILRVALIGTLDGGPTSVIWHIR